MPEIKQRNCNIELLRIVSMLLVMLTHYNFAINGTPNIELLREFPVKTIAVLELQSIVEVCVNCFILISGYFGIKWKWKSFGNYVFQVLFWCIIAYFSAIILSDVKFDWIIFGKNIAKFLTWNWFIIAYLGLYLIAPILNKFVDNSSNKELGIFIILFYIFQTIFGYVLQATPEFNQGMSFISLSGLYLIGAFIRRTEMKIFHLNKWVDLLLYLCSGFILVIISVLAFYVVVNKSVYGYLNPIVVLESVLLFLFFSKLKIHNSRVILWLSSSAFAIYLFHYNYNIYGWYLDKCSMFNEYAGFIGVFLFMLILFVIICLVDKVRILLWKYTARLLRI